MLDYLNARVYAKARTQCAAIATACRSMVWKSIFIRKKNVRHAHSETTRYHYEFECDFRILKIAKAVTAIFIVDFVCIAIITISGSVNRRIHFFFLFLMRKNPSFANRNDDSIDGTRVTNYSNEQMHCHLKFLKLNGE